MAAITEPARQTDVVADFDVLVCGGGPAGVAAALAAARSGARTGVIDVNGCLGGVWTAGALSWILDHDNKTGIMAEILAALQARGARGIDSKGRPTNAYDSEIMKVELERICQEAGVVIHYHTRVVAAFVDGRRLTHVITESKSGREAMQARAFVDCTGDGDLGAQAGCGFDVGHPETGATQPMTLMALIAGVDPVAIRPFYREHDDPDGWAASKDRLRAAMVAGGHDPSYRKPTLFHLRDDLFSMMANHEYEVSALDARDVTAATLRARAEIHRLVNGLRAQGGVWADVRVVATGAQIGVREGRRIRGLYEVTAEDLRVGARHDDAVCRVTFPIDVHATNPRAGKDIEASPFRSQPYDIPLRALIAADVDGLLLAGRCISGDFLAHSSYRVTGNSVALGEAAGRVGALAALSDRLPQDVAFTEIG